MARLKKRLPVSQSKVLNSNGAYSEQHRQFMLAVEKALRAQLPNQAALDGGATLSEAITAFNTLIANLKELGLMEE